MSENTPVCIAGANELDIIKTFECGQCFRWSRDENGIYTGIAHKTPARLYERGGDIYIETPAEDIWRDYFDLETDYEKISRPFYSGDYMAKCVAFGRGIRILRQEPWEALCSFIISQCNNISRIKTIVERLCELFGEKIDFDGEIFSAFPSPEKIAALNESDLAPLRCGYRAPYILAAARAVCEGEIDLEALKTVDADTSRAALKSLPGIGDKVANCVNLFGLGHTEAFPVDVWMKRALRENFPADFDAKSFGPYAGLAQQYIFYYARSGGK